MHTRARGQSVQRFYSPQRKVALNTNRYCTVIYWSNLSIKDMLARLRRNQDPGRGVTWEVPDDIDDEYLAQMESEHRVKERNQWMWKQIGKRPNHYFDCEAMQTAAATILRLIGCEQDPGGEDRVLMPAGPGTSEIGTHGGPGGAPHPNRFPAWTDRCLPRNHSFAGEDFRIWAVNGQ